MELSIVSKEMFGDKEVNIYENDKSEIFMTREQIGQALEYKSPRRAISDIHNRNKERMDKFSVVSKLRTTDGKRYETIIYNEKGIYEILRISGQPKADEFYDWVYELLSKLRKGEIEVNETNNTKLLLKAALEHEEKIETIESDVSYLKETMRIDGVQEYQIKELGKRKVMKSLGGYQSPAYEQMSSKVFARFWRDFKQHFTIPRYGELPRIKFDEATDFIKLWQPDTSTRIEIDSINRQMSIESDLS